jgi:hypothetical protein
MENLVTGTQDVILLDTRIGQAGAGWASIGEVVEFSYYERLRAATERWAANQLAWFGPVGYHFSLVEGLLQGSAFTRPRLTSRWDSADVVAVRY